MGGGGQWMEGVGWKCLVVTFDLCYFSLEDNGIVDF